MSVAAPSRLVPPGGAAEVDVSAPLEALVVLAAVADSVVGASPTVEGGMHAASRQAVKMAPWALMDLDVWRNMGISFTRPGENGGLSEEVRRITACR